MGRRGRESDRRKGEREREREREDRELRGLIKEVVHCTWRQFLD